MATRRTQHVGWGLSLSLTLHLSAFTALSAVLPHINVRPGVEHTVEFSVIREAPRAAPSAAPPAAPEPRTVPAPGAPPAQPPPRAQPASALRTPAAPEPAARARAAPAVERPKRASAPRRDAAPHPTPKPTPEPPTPAREARIQSATRADARSDGSALERVLRKIAATSALTQDERRKAMLVVLRTWENPNGSADAEALIDALLRELRGGSPHPPSDAAVR